MKTCVKCLESKQLSDFPRNNAMKLGYLNSCKLCVASAVRKDRREKPRSRAYDRARAKTPARKAHSRRITIEFREKYPDAYRAHTAVGNALRDGKLSRGRCLFCESDENIHAHHRDYKAPLDVIWLCAKCHIRLHANFPETCAHEPSKDKSKP
jgi:hypothetical protein